MKEYNDIDISIIVPIYNVEKYLAVCIDSLLSPQCVIRLEIILVDDGSTDSSGRIADKYAKEESCIKVIHKKNGGVSSARNAGLDIAEGKYIAFVDSDDWLKIDSLLFLYQEAIKYQVEIATGNMWEVKNNTIEPYRWISNELNNKLISGKEYFVWLVQQNIFSSVVVRNIYKKEYLDRIQVRFEEDIIHEDELWLPVILCSAEKIIVKDFGFYYYRQNEDSVMHVANSYHRLNSLFKVTDQLFYYSEHFDFLSNYGELKSWWYVNLFRLYTIAFMQLSVIKNTSYILPQHHLDCFWRCCNQMVPDAVRKCKIYYYLAKREFEKYVDWRISDRVASLDFQIRSGKKVILLFNVLKDDKMQLNMNDLPLDWVVTTDRKCIQLADIVVFHLPTLANELESDIEKQNKQIWVSCFWESEKNDSLINDPDINNLFDQSVILRQDEELEIYLLIGLCRDI